MRTKEALKLRILEICLDYDLCPTALSSRCGLTQSTVHNILSGRNKSTNVATVKKICDGIGMDLPTFFDCDLFRNLEQEIV